MKKFDKAAGVYTSIPAYEPTEARDNPPTCGLTITKVVREFVPLTARPGYGETVGFMIDQHLAAIIANGGEVQTIEMNFTPDEWRAFVATR